MSSPAKKFLLIITCLAVLGGRGVASAGYVAGIGFATEPSYFVLTDPTPIYPYALTGPGKFDGAVQSITEVDLQQRIAIAVQQIYRSAQINAPGYMLNVRISATPVNAAVGTNIYVGSSGVLPVPTIYGFADADAANNRWDLNPEFSAFYPNNYYSVTFADAIELLPVTFSSVSDVVNALAGTIAHELAHTFGVLGHDPATPVEGVYSVMASGAEGLPPSARLNPRTFLDIADENGGSAIDTLIANAGLVRATDFNFDGFTNVVDRVILTQNFGRSSVSSGQGDANGDGLVNVIDRALFSSDFSTPLDGNGGNLMVPGPGFRAFDSISAVPEPSGSGLLTATLALSLILFRRR